MSVGPPVQNPTDRGPVTTPAPSRPRAPIVPPGLSGNADQLRSGEGVLPLSPPRGDRRRHRGTQPPVGLLGGDGVRVLLAFDAATRCGRVFVDGQFVDTAQTLDGGVLRLAAGVHRVEVTCPGYRPFHTRFAAGAGEILRLRVGLERN